MISKTNNITCPVLNLSKFVAVAKLSLNSDQFLFKPGFRSGKKSKLIHANKALSYSRVNEIVRQRLSEFLPVDDAKRITIHSFRSGGATAAAHAGVRDRLFQRHGRWHQEKSKDRYVEDSLEERLGVSAALGL